MVLLGAYFWKEAEKIVTLAGVRERLLARTSAVRLDNEYVCRIFANGVFFFRLFFSKLRSSFSVFFSDFMHADRSRGKLSSLRLRLEASAPWANRDATKDSDIVFKALNPNSLLARVYSSRVYRYAFLLVTLAWIAFLVVVQVYLRTSLLAYLCPFSSLFSDCLCVCSLFALWWLLKSVFVCLVFRFRLFVRSQY